jgi:hypothetical protein
MTQLKTQWKGFGPDPRDTSSVLYVQPDDVVIPIREVGGKDGRPASAEMGDPTTAKDLWKENHG